MRRKPVNKSSSVKTFRSQSKRTKQINIQQPMRGGYRL
jgi:hypothetical protein